MEQRMRHVDHSFIHFLKAIMCHTLSWVSQHSDKFDCKLRNEKPLNRCKKAAAELKTARKLREKNHYQMELKLIIKCMLAL